MPLSDIEKSEIELQKAEQVIDNIAGIYMLGNDQKKSFLQQLHTVYERKIGLESIEDADEYEKELQSIDTQEKLLLSTINSNIASAVKTYAIPSNRKSLLTLRKDIVAAKLETTTDIIQLAIDGATKDLNISGIKILLDDNLLIEFFNKLCLLHEKRLRGTVETQPEIQQCIVDVKKAIDHAYEQQPAIKKEIDLAIEAQDLSNINANLKIHLEQSLLTAFANLYKVNEKTAPEYLEAEVTKCIDQITIAKELSDITYFNNLTLDEQKNYITQIQEQLKVDDREKAKEGINQIIEKILQGPSLIAIIANNVTPRSVVTGTVAAAATTYAVHAATSALGVAGNAVTSTATGLHKYIGKDPNIFLSWFDSAAMTAGDVAIFGSTTFAIAACPKLDKPLNCIGREIKDIFIKHKSYKERLFRSGAILTSTAGVAVGITFLVALTANPFSGPVIAGIAAGVFVIAGSALLAKKISKEVCKWRNKGLENEESYYEPTDKAKTVLGGPDKALKVSNFFKDQLRDLAAIYKDYKAVSVEKMIVELETTWSKIQNGDNPDCTPIIADLTKIITVYHSIEMNNSIQPMQQSITNRILSLVKPQGATPALQPSIAPLDPALAADARRVAQVQFSESQAKCIDHAKTLSDKLATLENFKTNKTLIPGSPPTK